MNTLIILRKQTLAGSDNSAEQGQAYLTAVGVTAKDKIGFGTGVIFKKVRLMRKNYLISLSLPGKLPKSREKMRRISTSMLRL